MATNFDFLKEEKWFASFADQAMEAEKSIAISYATVAILCRRALELAVRWLYANDEDLKIPYRDNLASLLSEPSFQHLIDYKIIIKCRYVVKLGNSAVHSNRKITRDEAVLSLSNLYEFCKWIQYCYAENYEERSFDESLLNTGTEQEKRLEERQDLFERLSRKDRELKEARRECEQLRIDMEALRMEHAAQRTFVSDQLTEEETRKRYIDLDLAEAGWLKGKNWLEEVEVAGMPNSSGTGRADYVLYGDNGKPLAVVEAKKTSVNPDNGSQQAKLYADCLQKQHGQRPLIFLTNGFETFLIDDHNNMPRRQVSGFFTKEELQLNVDRRSTRIPLKNITINDEITNRPYQKEAVTAVCDAIENRQRKMLIVQATGSGKTRVSISIVDVLLRHNYVKNVLFLADRITLVNQAKKNYSTHLPELTLCNLLDNKDDPEQSRMVFSTYPTILNAIDEKKRKDGKKMFTPAHFDLIIIDESHRSIYKKYQDIFNYFDAMLLGMTATPKDEIDKNTYGVFDLERGVPTYAYELDQAVAEKYLVDYSTLEYKTKIMETGIHYQDLSEEEKEQFDETFEMNPDIDKDVSSSAVNRWLFNADTIDMVLSELMEKGLKVEGGDKIGKTIIFARNSRHAAAVVERFRKIFSEYGDNYIQQIDYSIRYVDTLIDAFSTKDKMPQIAVSVDMLDTGVDIPEILNLVFFKSVRSYSKFWQMIGRGTRLCPDVYGPGLDKDRFLIFDFCNNFEFFRAEKHGSESMIGQSVVEKICNCKMGIIRALQSAEYQNEPEYAEYRRQLVTELHHAVSSLNDDSFRVKLHYRAVENFRQETTWQRIETVEADEFKKHIAPLMVPEDDDELARRFDYLMLSIELAELESRNANKNKIVVTATAETLSGLYSIPQVQKQKEIIEKVRADSFWKDAGIFDMESVREALRELIKYIEKKAQPVYYTDFEDNIIDFQEGEAIHPENDLKNYRQKVEYYLKEHQDSMAVYKLRNNKQLTQTDMDELERILFTELGTREDYQKEYGDTPVGRLVRRIVGVDREAVNEAFSEFLNEERFNRNQIHFVRLMIDYIVKNGAIEDKSILMEDPFRTVGAIDQVFENDLESVIKIIEISDRILDNCDHIA